LKFDEAIHVIIRSRYMTTFSTRRRCKKNWVIRTWASCSLESDVIFWPLITAHCMPLRYVCREVWWSISKLLWRHVQQYLEVFKYNCTF
jgi:hypothetical protein